MLDFVAAMEHSGIREAALKLSEWFSISAPGQTLLQKPSTDTAPAKEKTVGERKEPNKPPGFQLKGIDHTHAYLVVRGIGKETAESFGVGFFPGKGSMGGRVVIPIHNEHGELVAYAGRSIDGSEPRYKFPAGFHKSLALFNLHRVIGESNPRRWVVVVEGFFDCLKVSSAGFPCVALMGSSLSQAQEDLLGRHFKAAWLMLDGDEPGQKATAECLGRLGLRIVGAGNRIGWGGGTAG